MVYKALENIGALRRMGLAIDTRAAVLVFGLAHGFGLSTKLQDLALAVEGLVGNVLAFNLGVELGQLTALAAMLLLFEAWRRSRRFTTDAYRANVLLMSAGFDLFGCQMTGYVLS